VAEVRNICFSYGKKHVLRNLNFSVQNGECLVLAGPNGSGKSTALSIIAGAVKPSSGKVIADGRIGYVPQGNALFEDAAVQDNLKFFAVSALGHSPTMILDGECAGKIAPIPEKLNPINVEIPTLWALSETTEFIPVVRD